MKESTVKKLAEIFPASLVWVTFAIVITLSFVRPLWAIYFILIFVIYWIVRLFYMMVWLIISWRNYYRDTRINWLERIGNLDKDIREYYNVIECPTCGETYEFVERTY